MKDLNLVVSFDWFEPIANGEKKEEYREIKPFWNIRLLAKQFHGWQTNDIIAASRAEAFEYKTFDSVCLHAGYRLEHPFCRLEFKGIYIKQIKPDDYAPPGWDGKWMYAIKLGEILWLENYQKWAAIEVKMKPL